MSAEVRVGQTLGGLWYFAVIDGDSVRGLSGFSTELNARKAGDEIAFGRHECGTNYCPTCWQQLTGTHPSDQVRP